MKKLIYVLPALRKRRVAPSERDPIPSSIGGLASPVAEIQDTPGIKRLHRERDLYLRLLDLSAETEPESFLKEALALVVEITSALNGYIELHDPSCEADECCWSISHGFSEAETKNIRYCVSRGIIAEAIASGKTIESPSALLDPRFSGRGSVRAMGIEAVLCIPISSDPPLGVLYLQARNDHHSFYAEDRESAETFGHHLSHLARRLLDGLELGAGSDPTQLYRRTLQLHGLEGRSPALASLLKNIALVSPLDVSVLLTGESGTGKSCVAKMIHQNGPRKLQPFIELNCGALPDGLIESELFGALQGSHSTANEARTGKVEAADHGTLFLDEVANLSIAAQAKLLQLLQSHSFYPLGASTPRKVDVRLITATNVDLQEKVAQGRFREDLFYRLHVLPIELPNLSERRADIRQLAMRFCDEACDRHRLSPIALSSGALRALEVAEWPGNIRQLEHAVEAAVIRAAGAEFSSVERNHVFPAEPSSELDGNATWTFQEATRRFQADLIAETLEATGWNVSETARTLDLARSRLYKLIHAFDLERK
ncbi:MAG: Nif-specific regulatory protein [Planctomycetota bacterium]|jgi:Nif-specific regulatory protein